MSPSALSEVDVTGVRADLEALGFEIVPLTVEDAEHAARPAATSRRLGLSLGGHACLALARRLGLPVLTADRASLRLDVGVEVGAIR